MAKAEEDDFNDMNEDIVDDEPIPARRDIRIFHRKKDEDNKDEEFDEDIFV